MPVTYRIVEDLHLVATTWTGDVTLEESRRLLEQLASDPAFESDMLHFSDLTRARSRVTAEGIRGLARSSPFGPGSRRAVLVADDEMYGISRMYDAQATDSGTFGIFRDRDEALRWLGLTSNQLPEGIDAA